MELAKKKKKEGKPYEIGVKACVARRSLES